MRLVEGRGGHAEGWRVEGSCSIDTWVRYCEGGIALDTLRPFSLTNAVTVLEVLDPT